MTEDELLARSNLPAVAEAFEAAGIGPPTLTVDGADGRQSAHWRMSWQFNLVGEFNMLLMSDAAAAEAWRQRGEPHEIAAALRQLSAAATTIAHVANTEAERLIDDPTQAQTTHRRTTT